MQRWFRFRRDLGLQLLALYLLLIIPFLLMLWIFDGLVGQRIRVDVQTSDLALAQAIAQETDLALGNALDLVAGLADYEAVAAADATEMGARFDTILATHPNVNLVYRLSAEGTMLYHFPEGPTSTVGSDFSFRDYFQAALQTRQPLVSQGRISPTTNQAVATAVMPLWVEDGRFVGVVGANIKLESLSQTLTAITSEHQSETGFQVVILDSAGQIIAFPDSALLLHPADDLLPQNYLANFTAGENSQTLRAPNGEERLYTHARIEDIQWEVVVSRPIVEAFSTQIILRRIVLVAAATFLLIGLFFWGMLSARVIRPIEKLAPISEAIGSNRELQPAERGQMLKLSGRRDQIGHLIRSVLRMEESIRARMKEQATLLETSAAVISSLDLQIVLDRILEQMGRLLAIQMYAIIQLDEEHGSFRIRASRGLSRQFVESLSILPTEPDSVTMRALNIREPVQVSDTETDPSYVIRRVRARVEGYRALLAVPLNTQHAPPTALLVFHPAPHVFTQSEIQLLVNFSNHAAMAIENAILFERSDMQLEEQTNRLEALVQSLHDGLILNDLNGRVIYANRRVGSLANLSAQELAGMPVQQILARILSRSTGGDKTRKAAQRLYERGGERSAEISILDDGRALYLRLETFDVSDSRATAIGRGLLLHDITPDRELDRMRASLVSTVSHELRTPLASIKGYATTLLADDVQWDRDSQNEFLKIISDESDRLSELVNNILDLSRLDAGAIRLQRVKCNVEETIQKAAKRARLNGSRFEVQVEAGLPALFADPLRMETVLRNLFENAVKYGGESVSIWVEVQKQDRDILFRVLDDGPGIPAEESARVFESFYRVDDSLTRSAGGAGLGLAICQGLVHAHGGRIWVEPRSERGACIAFSIPARAKKGAQ
jgi:PAS domain S-box-containing protein